MGHDWQKRSTHTYPVQVLAEPDFERILGPEAVNRWAAEEL
jgi:hypothetical protein